MELPKKPHPKPVLPQRTPEAERLVSAAQVEDDASYELKLRPPFLREFIGQAKVKENLAVAIEAARSRGEALDHVLLYGPPGLGKTTLATIIANELGVPFQQTSGPTLQIKGDLTAVLTNLRERQVLFIDEVHRLQPVLEELLYSALEDYKLDIIIGQGPSARTHTMDVRPFTFIGATTRAGLLSAPLRSRFGILLRLEFYTHDDLNFIVNRSAEILGVDIDEHGAMRSPAAAAAPRASPTACCAACATTPRCAAPATSTMPPPRRRSRCSRSMLRLRRDRPPPAADHHREVPGRPGGSEHPGRRAGRRARRDRRNLRTLPHPDRLSRPHPARPRATQLAYDHFGIPLPRKFGLLLAMGSVLKGRDFSPAANAAIADAALAAEGMSNTWIDLRQIDG